MFCFSCLALCLTGRIRSLIRLNVSGGVCRKGEGGGFKGLGGGGHGDHQALSFEAEYQEEERGDEVGRDEDGLGEEGAEGESDQIQEGGDEEDGEGGEGKDDAGGGAAEGDDAKGPSLGGGGCGGAGLDELGGGGVGLAASGGEGAAAEGGDAGSGKAKEEEYRDGRIGLKDVHRIVHFAARAPPFQASPLSVLLEGCVGRMFESIQHRVTIESLIVRSQERDPENAGSIEARRAWLRKRDLQVFTTWCEACDNDLEHRRQRAKSRDMEMEREAKKEASIEAAANAVQKKHKADGWRKLGYKDVSRGNKRDTKH